VNDEMVPGRGGIPSNDKRRQSATAAEPAPPSGFRRAAAWFLHELRHMLPPTLFFFVGFNLILYTTKLILSEYLIDIGNFMLATGAALIVGKAVLVADEMPFLSRYDRGPLIKPILFKTFVYWVFVFVARLLEALVEFWLVQGHPLGEFLPHLSSTFSWHRFVAIQLWILVLFLIYVTASELNDMFGNGELYRILFTRRASELQLTRRQRIRELDQLNRLTEAYSAAELADPNTTAHRRLSRA
jgi:hypothetical protein